MAFPPYLKNVWVEKGDDGIYRFFFNVGTEEWMLNLSGFNPDELLSTEGPTLIQQKLDAWAEQDNPN